MAARDTVAEVGRTVATRLLALDGHTGLAYPANRELRFRLTPDGPDASIDSVSGLLTISAPGRYDLAIIDLHDSFAFAHARVAAVSSINRAWAFRSSCKVNAPSVGDSAWMTSHFLSTSNGYVDGSIDGHPQWQGNDAVAFITMTGTRLDSTFTYAGGGLSNTSVSLVPQTARLFAHDTSLSVFYQELLGANSGRGGVIPPDGTGYTGEGLKFCGYSDAPPGMTVELRPQ